MMKSSMLIDVDPSPPSSTLGPVKAIDVTSDSRPSPFSPLFHFHVLYWMQIEQQMGQVWEQG